LKKLNCESVVVDSKDLCIILVVQHDTIISMAVLWYEPAEQNLFHLNCDMHLLMVHGASCLDVCCNYVQRLWPGCREQHASKNEFLESPSSSSDQFGQSVQGNPSIPMQ